MPTIQQSSLVGEIYRYQLVGPPNFGLTNLRTLQDYVVTRRLMTIPGVVQINSWGGTTKQFNVDADLANDCENQIFGTDPFRQLPVDVNRECFGFALQ